jgi:hypothetical protein
MGLLSARQAEMAEAVVSWSRLRSRIAMIDSLALAPGLYLLLHRAKHRFDNRIPMPLGSVERLDVQLVIGCRFIKLLVLLVSMRTVSGVRQDFPESSRINSRFGKTFWKRRRQLLSHPATHFHLHPPSRGLRSQRAATRTFGYFGPEDRTARKRHVSTATISCIPRR